MRVRYFTEKYSIRLNILLTHAVLFWDLTQLKVINKVFAACFIIIYYLIAAASTYFIYKSPKDSLIQSNIRKISFLFLILLIVRPTFAIQSIILYPILFNSWKSKSAQTAKLIFYSIALYLIAGVVLINLLLGSPFKEKEIQRVYSPDNKHYASVVNKTGFLDQYCKIKIGDANAKFIAHEKTVYNRTYNVGTTSWKSNDSIMFLMGGPCVININNGPFYFLDWSFNFSYYIRYLISEILLILLIYYLVGVRDKLNTSFGKDLLEIQWPFYKY